jgi:hypothetical protein
MKIFVEHDDIGNIYTVALATGTSAITVLQPGPGRLVSEVEAAHVRHEKDYESLRSVRREYRVEGHPTQPRLMRK